MKKFIAAATLAATAVTGLAVASPADAANMAQCFDRSEFRHVKKGMSPDRVKRVLHGQSGKVTYRDSYSMTKEYKPCGSRWGFVTIDWDNYNSRHLEVGYKSAYWG